MKLDKIPNISIKELIIEDNRLSIDEILNLTGKHATIRDYIASGMLEAELDIVTELGCPFDEEATKGNGRDFYKAIARAGRGICSTNMFRADKGVIYPSKVATNEDEIEFPDNARDADLLDSIDNSLWRTCRNSNIESRCYTGNTIKLSDLPNVQDTVEQSLDREYL